MPDMSPRYYACKNRLCEWYERPREVYPQRITGAGLYTWPSVYCECSLTIECPRVREAQGELMLDFDPGEPGSEPCS